MAQESLTNVARHAQASQVTVKLRTTTDQVILRIADDGQGFDPADAQNGSTMGIKGMRERLVELGGTLKVDSKSGTGTRIVAHLPYPAHKNESESDE